MQEQDIVIADHVRAFGYPPNAGQLASSLALARQHPAAWAAYIEANARWRLRQRLVDVMAELAAMRVRRAAREG